MSKFQRTESVIVREEAARRRHLRRPVRRTRGVARVGGRRVQQPRSRSLRAVAIRIEKDGRWTLPRRPPSLVSAADVIQARAERARLSRDRSASRRASGRRHVVHDRSQRDTAASSSRASRSTSCFRCCMARTARTGRFRACSSSRTCPYVGAGVLASAVGMDKAAMKLVFAARGLPICDYEVVLKRDWQRDERAIMNTRRRPGLASRCS